MSLCITWMRLWRKPSWFGAACAMERSHVPRWRVPICLHNLDEASLCDDEHPHAQQRMHFQRVMASYVDERVLRQTLMHTDEAEGAWSCTRISEVGDPNIDYSWLWRLSTCDGPVLDADESADAVRFRLPCAGLTKPIFGAAFNTGMLDPGGAHASYRGTSGHWRCWPLCTKLPQRATPLLRPIPAAPDSLIHLDTSPST